MGGTGWIVTGAIAAAGLAVGACTTLLAARIARGESPWRPDVERAARGSPAARAGRLPLPGWVRGRAGHGDSSSAFGAWYPAAALITAAGLVAVWLRLRTSPELPAFCYLAVLAVPLALIDVRYLRLPDVLTLPSYPIALVLLGAGAPFVPAGGRHLAGALIGMAAVWLFYALQVIIYPAGMGWGDVKLSGLIGLYLGWFGPRALLAGVLGGYLLAAVTGIVLLAARRAGRKSRLPFGPFMMAGALIVIVIPALSR